MTPVAGRASKGRRVGEERPAWSPADASACLLDVNVVLALLDPAHTFHHKAHAWFVERGRRAWATCPLIQNAVVRIASQPRYLNSPGPAPVVAGMLAGFCARPGHEFWPDDISLLDAARVDVKRLIAPAMVTDSYLLALAVAHGGRLATFDSRLVTDAVTDGRKALHVIS